MTDVMKLLDEILERRDAATKEPWSVPHLSVPKEECTCDCPFVLSETCFGAVATIHANDGRKISEGGGDDPPLEEAKANGIFIAHARTDLPRLVKALRVYDEAVRTVIAEAESLGVSDPSAWFEFVRDELGRARQEAADALKEG